MRKLFIIVVLSLFNINAFGEGIFGIWYRNSIFREAELVINENMKFSIEATNNANFGNMEGELIKIRDGYYYSYIKDFDQACIVIFVERINYIELFVYGDQVGAGAGVYFDGKYENQKMTHDEHIENVLDYIIGDRYDKNIIKDLLGTDLEYFLACFATVFAKNIENGLLLEGYVRGIAPYQNGIIKIENDYIYIIITDCRNGLLFRYYTNNTMQDNIPDEFRQWYYFNEQMNIQKGIME